MEISSVNFKTYKKMNENNKTYTLNIKIKETNSIYISIIFEENIKIYEDFKSIEEIKKQQNYFGEFTAERIFNEINNFVENNNIEVNKKDEKILFNLILPSEEKPIIIFELKEKKIESINDSIIKEIINQKNEVIKQKDEIIKEKDEIINEKNKIICELKELLIKYKQEKEINNVDETPKGNQVIKKIEHKNKNENTEIPKGETETGNLSIKNVDDENSETITYENILDENFNIRKIRERKILNVEKDILTIIQLNDGRLAAGRSDGKIIIYNKEKLTPEITITESSSPIWDLIQLKNNHLISCSCKNKSINIYRINQNNKYELLSQNFTKGPEDFPRKSFTHIKTINI